MSEELRPCCNPKCQHTEPKVFDENWEAYVFCPKCLMRGPEYSVCTNRRLYAEVGWDSLPRQTDEDALRADLARKDAEIAALDELVVQLENGLHLAQPYILPESRYWKQGIARSIAIQLRSARAKLAEVRGAM